MIVSRNNLWLLLAVLVCTITTGNNLLAQQLNHIYKGGEEGYNCFRIPSLVTTSKGTVLAFAEARKINCGDAGDIDMVVKRSEDGGKTWSPLQVIWNDSANTCGNPAPVVDQQTGNIILLSTWNLGADHEKDIINGSSKDTRRVFVLRSTDDGKTWSQAAEITKNVKKNNWTWYATGPGRGIQLSKGRHKGRLVIPSNHIVAKTKKNYSHVIYSDDGGNTWKLGGVTKREGVNESTIAELSDGRLLLNMRNAGKSRYRQVAISKNAGKKWSAIYPDTVLIEPVCEANLIQYKFPGKKNLLVFSNPASTTSRVKMTVRISEDDGKTWPLKKLIYEGPSAYSCLTVLPNGNLGLFYEAGIQRPYEGIAFEEIAIDDFK
ncbi:sialidase family protein [Terrimonas pollutisoli]|uniref:sialidase family protein n=1 Tax=Terrimonas pollutisoli TaxID=3034147 RepID=UPI0023EB341E|nr:sialidase family protein [Terrimonas sp. H1YJ31]